MSNTDTTHSVLPTGAGDFDRLTADCQNPEEIVRKILSWPCSSCCNLDARKTPFGPALPGYDWARNEYAVATNTPSTKLSVKREDLLDCADGGCMYCNLLCKALSIIRPAWETEKSFVELFLSPNLPVIVRWNSGVTSAGQDTYVTAVGPQHEPERFGYEIEVKFVEGTRDLEAPVEFEIYRPEVAQLSSENDLSDTLLSPLVNHIGTAPEEAWHAESDVSIEFISNHITTCLQNHSCGDNRTPQLPDRVLWTDPGGSGQVRLIESNGAHARYIALSYCWGPKQQDTFLTDAKTFADRKAGFRASDLPPLFIDVLTCARALGIDYIWIDRLCIIQGDASDWSAQAPKMGQYYGNATLSLVAASAESEMDSILVERDPKWRSYGLNIKPKGALYRSLGLRFRRRPYLLGLEAQGGEYGKVSKRAWIWQERLLAARTVFFTPSALKFECRHHSVWEGYDASVTSPSWTARVEKMTHLDWFTLVQEFSRRDITYSLDRLPAINSVTERIANIHGWIPIWGLWKDFLDKSLAWTAQDVLRSGEDAADETPKHPCSMHPKYTAPSWSWASIEGPVTFTDCLPKRGSLGADKIKLDISDVDSASGVLTIEAYAFTTTISCSIGKSRFTRGNAYIYECPRFWQPRQGSEEAAFLKSDVTISADVPLRPTQQNSASVEDAVLVERVPFGQEPPKESWTGRCLAVLIGHTRLTANILLLGSSSRVPGAWERIGLAGGRSLGSFVGTTKSSIRIA